MLLMCLDQMKSCLQWKLIRKKKLHSPEAIFLYCSKIVHTHTVTIRVDNSAESVATFRHLLIFLFYFYTFQILINH
ncbi:V-type proton ATPase subunit [Trichinella pseudospiralis]